MDSIGRSLNNLGVIAWQEFRLYFLSPIVYVAAAVWFAFTAFFFFANLFIAGSLGQSPEPTMDYAFTPMSFLTIMIAPALTAKLLSDEIRAGTHELLFTSPVRDWEIVTGKWLGSWGIMTLFILITFPFPLLLILRGNPDVGDIGAAYLGIWLLWGAVLALGVFTSSLTQYQFVAFITSFGILIFLWISSGVSQFVTQLLPPNVHLFQITLAGGRILNLIDEATLTTHFRTSFLSRGMVNPLDVAYFVGLILVSLFFAAQMLGARRWRA